MPKVARISTSVPVSSVSEKSSALENSAGSQFISIAIFSGIGLLISLVVVLFGVQAVWY